MRSAVILLGLLSSILESKTVVKYATLLQRQTVESPSVSPMEVGRFCFIPDGFFSCPGIGVVFSFSDIMIT